MQVIVNSDNTVIVTEEVSAEVEASVRNTLGRFEERLTRVEVHLNDANSHKGGQQDKHCNIEARPRGLDPVAATNAAGSVEEAVRGAVHKLERVLDSRFGKLDDHR